MPCLNDVVGVEEGPHLDCDFAKDEGDGGDAEDPGVKVEKTGEETEATTPAGTGSDGGPMVD